MSFPPLKPSPNLARFWQRFFQIRHEILWGVIWGGNLQMTLVGKELRLLFVAVFLGCTSTGRVGLFFFVVLCPGTPKGSTSSGSGFKVSQKTGQWLKVSSDRHGEARNQTCDPWFTRQRFIPYTTVASGKELRFILNGVLAISSVGDLFIACFKILYCHGITPPPPFPSHRHFWLATS